MWRLRSLCLLVLVPLTACVAADVPSEDPGYASAIAATDSVFYFGSMKPIVGYSARSLRKRPAGIPIYVIDLVNEPSGSGMGVTGVPCFVNTYYTVNRTLSTVPGLHPLDDMDAQMASCVSTGGLVTLPTQCSESPCDSDPAYFGDDALVWDYMENGIHWTPRPGESLRVFLRPTSPIIDDLQVVAVCNDTQRGG